MAHGDPQNIGLTSYTVPEGSNVSIQWDNTTEIDLTPDIHWNFGLEDAVEWEGVLAVEGILSSDGRYLMPGKIDWRELPLSLMVQTETAEGHDGAWAAGKITEIVREPRPDLGSGAVAIVGRGVFASDEDGQRARGLLDEEVLRHVSIDFAPTASYLLDPETLEVVDTEEMDIMGLLGGDFVRGYEGKIMGATLCAFSAFEEATLRIVEVDSERVLIACGYPMRKVLTASAAGVAPLAPPYDWFFQEETAGPCPLTVTPEGKVYGHLALWNQCHRRVGGGACEMAPKSRSGYAFFHTGALTTEDGRKVNVGRLTVGDGGHAPTSPYLGTQGAIDHYDKTGTVAAFVRATDGRYGIWLSGAVRSDCPAEKVRDMEANPPSGDWREESGRLELCAALAVPVAGFPIPRYEAALVASGQDERIVALVASGYSEPGEWARSEIRKFERLKRAARYAISSGRENTGEEESDEVRLVPEWDDGFADISAGERKRAAKSGAALPDGSFPIRNCAEAEKAIRAQGRASEGKRGQVRSHIRKRVSSLGCTGDIFDPYK